MTATAESEAKRLFCGRVQSCSGEQRKNINFHSSNSDQKCGQVYSGSGQRKNSKFSRAGFVVIKKFYIQNQKLLNREMQKKLIFMEYFDNGVRSLDLVQLASPFSRQNWLLIMALHRDGRAAYGSVMLTAGHVPILFKFPLQIRLCRLPACRTVRLSSNQASIRRWSRR